MPINKFITNLDLARQAEILSGETAVFQGGMQLGLPFSGFPSGVDTSTIVSLGVQEIEYTAFSGGSGTTLFDVVNPSSPYYSVSAATLSASPYTIIDVNTITETVSATTYPTIMTFTALSGDCCSTPISVSFTPPIIQELYDRGLYDGLFNGLGQATIGTTYIDESFYNVGSFFSGANLDMEIIEYGVHGSNPSWATGTTSGTVIEYSALTQYWANPIYENLTSGLTLPITPISAETQTSDYVWTLTDSTIIDDNLIGLQYTGYNVTYSFDNVIDDPATQTYIIGGVTATLEYFSAGTLDYKNSIEWLKVRGNATIDERLTTDRLTINTLGTGSPVTMLAVDINGNVVGATGGTTDDTGAFTSTTANNTIIPTNAAGNTNNSDYASILAGQNNTISGTSTSSAIVGGATNVIDNALRSVVLGGQNITATDNDTVYTPNLIVNTGGTASRLGINTDSPQYILDVHASTGNFFFSDSVGGLAYISGVTGLPRFQVSAGVGGVGTGAGGTIGMRAWDDVTYTTYGQPGDMHIYAGISSNGLNIISADGSGVAEDYIRFYAGRGAGNGDTADIHIHGTGVTAGYVGIGTNNPVAKLHVSGNTRVSGNGLFYTNIDGTTENSSVISGGTTALTFFEAKTIDSSSIRFGVRGSGMSLFDEYGKTNDSFLYSSINSNGLNLISADGIGTEDYIRFYAGQNAEAINTSDIHIHGTGLTRGFVGLGTENPLAKLDVNGNTKISGTLNIGTLGGGSSVSNLGVDVSGNVVVGTSGGGVTIDPYNDLGNVNTSQTWDVSGTSTNYQLTLTGSITLNLNNVRDGDYGTLIVEQDGVGSHTLAFGTVNGGAGTHKVVNGGGGSPTLTSTPNAIDLLSFTYNGTTMYWTVGNDYT